MKKFKFISIFVAVIATALVAINFASCQQNGLESGVIGKWTVTKDYSTTVINFKPGGKGVFEYTFISYSGHETSSEPFTYKMKNAEEGEISITYEVDYEGEHYTDVETYTFKIRGNQLDLYFPSDYYSEEERLMATYTRM